MLEFTDTNFSDEVLGSEIPVLVDFSAVWCGPCKAIAPTVEALADEYNGRIKVGKMDIDNNPDTPVKYHVRAVPTLILFKGGQPVDQVMGAVNKRRIQGMFDAVL
ncbi:MAG TPA: thioredoxin [Deltaproteobacteria bacterium]|nr:thioredoxin [Deltaproteobacteria bacterium]HCP48068.1 thioredoxin [Deltaproteobacteria bacterium]